MKKILCIFALCCTLIFSGCKVEEMSTLRDISRPYAGEYKCRKLTLGGQDLLGRFDYLKLNLNYFGKFRLTYAEVSAGEGEYSGTYEAREEEIAFCASAGGEKKRYVFPYESGTVRVELLLGEKLLYAEFSAL